MSSCGRDNSMMFPSNRYIDRILVSQRMVGHFRRVGRAKSTIDNQIPKSFISAQIRRNSFSARFLMRSTTSLNSGGPDPTLRGSLDSEGTEVGQPSCQRGLGSTCSLVLMARKSTETPGDVIERFPSSFEAGKPFHPRIKKTNAVSRLRSDSKLYYPPKPRNSFQTAPKTENVRKTTENSSSSTDLLLPPSSSPRKTDSENSSSFSSTLYNGTESIRTEEETFEDAKNEDYAEFLVGVSDEILAKGIFTNNAISQICERHVEQNRGRLSRKIMNSRISALKERLGILDQRKICSESSSDSTQNGNSSNILDAKREPNLKARSRRRSSGC